jgi:hypothetical protein
LNTKKVTRNDRSAIGISLKINFFALYSLENRMSKKGTRTNCPMEFPSHQGIKETQNISGFNVANSTKIKLPKIAESGCSTSKIMVDSSRMFLKPNKLSVTLNLKNRYRPKIARSELINDIPRLELTSKPEVMANTNWPIKIPTAFMYPKRMVEARPIPSAKKGALVTILFETEMANANFPSIK